MRKQDGQFKAQARDFAHLQINKTELQSLQSVSSDSAKLLTEKLTLSRELNALRPEMDHLKSQLSHQQSILAEKLALERQLNSIEVELEAEKRSKQRSRQREDQEQMNELHARIEDLEAKLTAEKKDKERVRKEGERALSEAVAQQEVLEQRLETMKLKLRDTREELKKCQSELSESRTSTSSLVEVPEGTISLPIARKRSEKRRVEEATTEMTIQTPGAADQKTKKVQKKRGLDIALANVGEKSTFSITPFLNRTKMLENDSSESFDDDEPSHNSSDAKSISTIAPIQLATSKSEVPARAIPTNPAAKPRGRPRKILGEIADAKNSKALKSLKRLDEKTKTAKVDFVLEKVVEEPEEGEDDQPAPSQSQSQPRHRRSPPKLWRRRSWAKPEPKKKKRKLLGGPNKTLFDDEDGEAAKPPPKAPVAKRALGKAGVTLGAKQNAFAGKTFSPLKRDRRASRHEARKPSARGAGIEVLRVPTRPRAAPLAGGITGSPWRRDDLALAPSTCPAAFGRASSSSASSRWKSRQGKDPYAREAKVQGLKSRAAFKLLEMDVKYRLFKKGQIVVDLVAHERTKPHNHVLGIDLLPAQPPRGVSSIQGNFLSPACRPSSETRCGRPTCAVGPPASRRRPSRGNPSPAGPAEGEEGFVAEHEHVEALEEERSYLDMERLAMRDVEDVAMPETDRVVDIVLSDMSAPWLLPTDFRKSGVNNAFHRMMNTSGIAFRDHAGSMDLCGAALRFASDTLRNGGHFVCKFYQGSEDKEFEKRLRRLFDKVYREKPDSSRKVK
ncbi:unnamed protein product [Parascedosporium putredinis]|uniref:rRNA methyltransferase 2, mitochondrial n=2 Tax=Parascedosporium putredinis TaxID=1442378 RepID=A0A9P1H2U7_9PEZI|nr:unnamed protein product [Parascedosporium putredinis]CAI7995297.1 unnamed protein product [Parascedosporium putredinis]